MKQEENVTFANPVSPCRRPKRNVSHKALDGGNGLLWREEKEIKKALYASLNESRKSKLPEHEGSEEILKPKTKPTHGEPSPKKARVHAQRKFAQGSTPNSPIPTPVKMCPAANVAVDLFPCRRPKTEDFLTFLCLRGTPILPPSLDFFNNWAKEEATSEKSYVSEADSCHKEEQGPSENSFHKQTAAKLAAIKKKLGSDAKTSVHSERLRNASSSKRKILQDDCNVRRKSPLKSTPQGQNKSSLSVLKEKYKKQLLQRKNNPVNSSKRTVRNMRKNEPPKKSITRSESVTLQDSAKRTSFVNKAAVKNSAGKSVVKNPAFHGKQQENLKKGTSGNSKATVQKKPEPKKDLKVTKEEIKMSLEKKQSLRSAVTFPVEDSLANNSLSRIRKAKLVPPIVDLDSGDSDFEVLERKPLAKYSGKATEQKSKTNNKLSAMQNATICQPSVEHSYVKPPPPGEKIKVPLPKFTKIAKKPIKVQLVKGSQKAASIKKLKPTEVSKPITRSSKLKESLAKTALKSAKNIARQKGFAGKQPRKNEEVVARGRRPNSLISLRNLRNKREKRKIPVEKRNTLERERRSRETTGRKTNTARKAGEHQELQKPTTKSKTVSEKIIKRKVTRNTVGAKRGRPSRFRTQMKYLEERVVSSKESDTESDSESDDSTESDSSKSSLGLLKQEYEDYSVLTDTDEGPPRLSCFDNIAPFTEAVPEERTLLENPSSDISESAAFIIENMTENVDAFDTISNEMAAALPGELVFGNGEEIQGLMTTEFSGVFDGAILLTTRDSLSQVPLQFIQDISVPKCMADAATNTCEEDILACMNEEASKNEDMSVGTQTITPLGSPDPPVQPASPLVQPISTKEKTTNKAQSSAEAATSPTKPKNKKKNIFPGPKDPPKIVKAPVYTPTLEEFKDPLEFIEKIQSEAEIYGICKIVPPPSFKPECKVNDDMRFTAHNQYIHKMFRRWGPNVKHVASIRKHLASQGLSLHQAPLIGGMEMDLSRLYHTVQNCGGLRQVIEKKKWQRVADAMHIPKTAQDRVNKLYEAYCKYLVSFDTLSKEDKDRLEEEVIAQHQRKVEQKALKNEEDEDDESSECVSKGRSIALSAFYRIARNTMAMWYRNEPSPDEVEKDYWKLVSDRQRHVVVHAGNIDSSVYGSGFPSNRGGPFCKHPWNLKVLTNNPGSVLRSMGPASGVTIPTLHVGMVYTTGCWYRDPHGLPWIEYLHTGASKIWYGIPSSMSKKFGEAMKEIMPSVCTNNPIWLSSDSAMLPPNLLVEHDVSLSRIVQESGQFVVIFPGAFTSSICTGYIVSESVYFAPPWWLDSAREAFKEIKESCEPPMFSLEKLLFAIASDSRSQLETLQKLLPHLNQIRDREFALRKQLAELGLKQSERLPLHEIRDGKKRKHRGLEEENDLECDICRTQCYISMVVNSQEETMHCLQHACQYIKKKKNTKSLKLVYTYDEAELNELVEKVSEQIHLHSEKINSKKKVKKKVTLS